MAYGESPGAEGTTPQRSVERPRILLVDDEPDILESLRDLLNATMDADVVTAGSAAAAFDRLEEARFDLVLSDFKMPLMDGLEFLSLLRTTAPQTARVMITAYPDDDLARRARDEAGVDVFLSKPLDSGNIVHVVERVLAEQRRRKRAAAAGPPMLGRLDEAALTHCAASLDRAVAQAGVHAAALLRTSGMPVVVRGWSEPPQGWAPPLARLHAAAQTAAAALGRPVLDHVLLALGAHRWLVTEVGPNILLALAMDAETPLPPARILEQAARELHVALVHP